MKTPDPTPPPGVLFVDDEPHIRKALTRCFRGQPFSTVTAASVETALEELSSRSIAVVVSDQHLGSRSGLELLAQLRERHPDVVRILLTGRTDLEIALEAINRAEVYRLLTKPWEPASLREAVAGGCALHRSRREAARLEALTARQNHELQSLNRTLEARVLQSTLELRAKNEEVRTAYLSTVRTLAEAVDAKDPYTRGHSERVGVYAARIAAEMGLAPALTERVYLAGLLHDIGKIGIPDAILGKPSRLTPDEYAVMRQHPEIGARILEPVRFLADILPCVRHHHEWYDGSEAGYPDRLSGRRIPLGSRIILVADTVEAMTSDRPYRRALPLEEVISEVQHHRGSQLDPVPADACLALLEREEEDFLTCHSKFDIETFMTEDGSR